MSNEVDPTAGRSEAPDVLVAQALAGAVRDGGRGLAGEPRRVQGMVNDVLGAEGRTRRAEVDAVVLAAEEAIPESLLANSITLDQAVESLRARGLDSDIARFAVEVWRYALGMLADDAEPPSLTNSLRTPTGSAPTDVGATVHPDAAVVAATSLDDRPVDRPDDGSSGDRRIGVLVGAGVAVLVLIAAAVLVFGRGGDGDTVALGETTAESSAVQTRPSQSTVSITSPPTTVAPTVAAPVLPTAVEFEPETESSTEYVRTWELDGGELVGTLDITNVGEADATTRVYEALPASLVASADLITSVPEHEEIELGDGPGPIGFRAVAAQDEAVDTPIVISWQLEIPAGATESVTYRIDVDADASVDDFDRWQRDREAAAETFAEIRVTPPTLDVSLSADTVVVGDTVVVTGRTDPSATASVDGAPIPVGADGGFTHEIAPTVAGDVEVVVAASSRFGVRAEATFVVVVEPAPTTTTTRATVATTSPPTGTTGPTTGTTRPPTGTTKPPVATTTTTTSPPSDTPPPPDGGTAPDFTPPPPPLSLSIVGPSTVGEPPECNPYTYSLSANFTIVNTDWSGGSYWDGQTTVSYNFSGLTPGLPTSFSVTAWAADGRSVSATKSVSVIGGTCPG